MNVSIKDIAQRAGVSPATVSRAINRPELLNTKTLAKVRAAIKTMGYSPNHFASNLRQKRSNTLLVALPNVSNPFNEAIIDALEKKAGEKNIRLLISNLHNESQGERLVSLAQSGQVDGILLYSAVNPFVDKTQVPIVNVCEELLDGGYPSVSANDSEISAEVIDHLVKLGHTRIAAVTGTSSFTTSLNRLKGVREGLSRNNLPYDESLIIHSDYSIEGGKFATQKLLAMAERPSAIFYFNDDMAIGGLSELHQANVRVPDDIAIFGYDNLKYSEHTQPALSTVRQPIKKISELAFDMLEQLVAGKALDQEQVSFKCELVIRESCR